MLYRITSDAQAQQRRFLSSPTVRVGLDVDPGADARQDYGLTCRIYRDTGSAQGQPLDA